MPNPIAYFDITVGGQPKGRLTFELFQDVVPKTAENFLKLCSGEAGETSAGVKKTYAGSSFHRCIKGKLMSYRFCANACRLYVARWRLRESLTFEQWHGR